MQSEATYETVS